jgi:protein TonB
MEKKKNPNVDFLDKRPLFILLSLCASISLALLAFEYKSIVEPPSLSFYDESGDRELYDPPITINEPPKPPVQQPILVEIRNDEIPEIEIDPYIFKTDPTNFVFEEYLEIIEEAPEPEIEIHINVEEEASFPGGNDAWAKYLQKNFVYPKQAQRARIEGKVILSFVVNKEGKISDIEVLRSIGSGCEEEAIRVLSKAPKWNPGKQRGVPVKSRKQIAFVFKLR